MSKLYKCSKCESVEENDTNKKPVCCETEMKEVTEEELFSCPGCAGCHVGCGNTKNEE
jgi:hypothetical protein